MCHRNKLKYKFYDHNIFLKTNNVLISLFYFIQCKSKKHVRSSYGLEVKP